MWRTYSNKVIYGQMIEDERFTVAESLKEYAQAKLDEMAVPAVSYECDVVDVAAYDSDYSFLQIEMHKAVWLLDKLRNTRTQHRVVAYERHPGNPENNKVTLATVIKPVQKSVKSIEEMLNDPNSEFVQRLEVYADTTAENATKWLLGAKGGNVIFRKNDDGQPEAILIADGLDINTAQNVWLWNVNGLGFSSNGINGPYETAITSDGNIVGKFVTAEGLHVNAANVDGTLSVSQIDAENLHVKAANVDGTFSAKKISGGTIDAETVNITNLSADNITTGMLNGNRIEDLPFSKMTGQISSSQVSSKGDALSYLYAKDIIVGGTMYEGILQLSHPTNGSVILTESGVELPTGRFASWSAILAAAGQ